MRQQQNQDNDDQFNERLFCLFTNVRISTENWQIRKYNIEKESKLKGYFEFEMDITHTHELSLVTYKCA